MSKKLTLKKAVPDPASQPPREIPIHQVICGQVQKTELKAVPIKDLIPYPKNPRKNDNAVAALATSLKEYGYVKNSILVDENMELLAGHTTLKAMVSLGWDKVPEVTQVSGLTTAQKKGYRIADNKLGELAEWDPELLIAELDALKIEGFDIALTGFDPKEIAGLELELHKDDVPQDAEPQISRAEELRKEWGTELGQLWQCGPHMIVCGDCTDPAVVACLLRSGMPAAEVPGLMVTDPPYGVEYDPHWRDDVVGEFGQRAARGDGAKNDDIVDWTKALELFKGNVAYVWHAGKFAAEVAVQLHTIGFEIRNQIIWRKQHFALSRGDYHWQHEPCWYAVRKGHKSDWCGDRTQTTVWDIASLNPAGRKEERYAHGTQKPIECMLRPVQNHNFNTVYDPFLGSGTTMIACENLGRKCRGCEIDPGYVAVCLQRYKDVTGNDPVLVDE